MEDVADKTLGTGKTLLSRAFGTLHWSWPFPLLAGTASKAAKTGLCAVGSGKKERKPKQLMSRGNLPPAKHAEAKFKRDDTAAAESNAWLRSGQGDGKSARNFDFGSVKTMAHTVLSVPTFF